MNLLLANLFDKCMLVYMDNILIYSKMADDHVAHVKAVSECLAAQNWHVKEKKCALFLPEVEFLGHVVSAEGVLSGQHQRVRGRCRASWDWQSSTGDL